MSTFRLCRSRWRERRRIRRSGTATEQVAIRQQCAVVDSFEDFDSARELKF